VRFKGFASIPLDAGDAALQELHHAIFELRLHGAILLSNIRGRALTHPDYRPFFAEANRIKLCIFLHPMLPAHAQPFGEYVLGPLVGFPFDTTLAVARMCFDGLFRDFPDIRWVIGHLGGAVPYLMERLDNGFRDFAECRSKIDQLRSTYWRAGSAAVQRHDVPDGAGPPPPRGAARRLRRPRRSARSPGRGRAVLVAAVRRHPRPGDCRRLGAAAEA
jgi:predicted TIM-barrel fold metal-dependent hydrolase